MGNKVKARDYTLANNPYAHIHFGPSGEPSKKGEDLNTCMTTLLRSGHSCIFTNDGNKGEVANTFINQSTTNKFIFEIPNFKLF